jgi:hypothetical protein
VDLFPNYANIGDVIFKIHERYMGGDYNMENHRKFVKYNICQTRKNPFFNILSVFIVHGASQLEFYELLKTNTKYLKDMNSICSWKMVEIAPKHGYCRYIPGDEEWKYIDILLFAVKERCENLINALLALNYPLDRGTIKEKAFSKNPCRQRILEIRRKQKTQQACATEIDSLFENMEISHDSVGSITTLLDDTIIS